MVVIDGGFILEVILMIIFLVIGLGYCLPRSSTKSSPGIIYLVVALVFIILALIIGLELAGVQFG